MDTRQLGEITAFGIVILRQATSDVLTCTISEAQKFVALADTLPINGNMIIFITALQELLIDIVAHAARHGTDAITLETNNGVLCTQRELFGRASWTTESQQSKLSNNAHEARSRSEIKLKTVNEDTLSALTSLGKNAKLKKTETIGCAA